MAPRERAAAAASVMRLMAHPLRVRILWLLTAVGEQPLSPSAMAVDLGEPLGNVSYHVRFLVDAGVLKLVRTEPRRGAVEHYYRPAVDVAPFLAVFDALAEATNPDQKGDSDG